MLQPEAVARVLRALKPQEKAALARVQEYGGNIPGAVLEREFGGVRKHADYPNPRAYLLALEQPAGPTERLYTLALLHQTQQGMHRTYAIPPDLLALLPPVPERDRALRLTGTSEPEHITVGDPRFLERNLLILLALGQDGQLEVIPSGGLNKASLARIARQWDPKDTFEGAWREEHWPYIKFVRRVGEGAKLLRVCADARLRPTREALEWLQQLAAERARRLLEGWIASDWDELVSFEGMKIQNSYFRDLPAAKRAIVSLIGQAPPGEWITFDSFVAAVKTAEPDFARPDGRYDSWGLISYARQPLNGFEFWDEVEGQQLKGIAGATLRWLGLTDLGQNGEEAVSFRVNELGAALLCGSAPPAEPPIEPLVVQPNFEVVAPAYALPYARFQLGRIAERAARDTKLEPGEDEAEIYRLTKRSVQAALERDISLDDMLRFLHEQGEREPPQNVVATLREWAGQHGQVSLRRGVLLEAADGALLEQIKRDKRVRLPKVERLSERAWLVREGDAPELSERLRKAGYGPTGQVEGDGAPLREHDLTVLFAALEFYTYACSALGIEGEASVAMRQRVARLLPDKQLNRAYQSSHEALKRLKERLGEK